MCAPCFPTALLCAFCCRSPLAHQACLRLQVKVLNKEVNGRLHHSIHRLPALVLDCEKDIHDLDAQKEHADKVNAYFEYVKDMRKHRAQLGYAPLPTCAAALDVLCWQAAC